jgi:predicted RNase H-like HicB family nuclease
MSIILTAIIQHEGDWYVALCPELDVASQGRSIEESRHNLVEAVELFLASALPEEIQRRSIGDVAVINT